MDMKIGVMIGADGGSTTLDDVIGIAQRAEAAGMDSVWMANIFSFDAISTLALIGRETKRIALGTAVTPTYPFWGKRPVFSSTFYPALKHPNVELVPHAVESVTETAVIDAEGVAREVDILVFATGFEATNYLGEIDVVGREGRSIQEYWSGEPRAFLGITVPTFPNLYILYGPGTNGGEIASNLRFQSAYARRAIRRMMRQGVTSIEVKRTWADRYHAWLQSKMDDTAWAVSQNYFANAAGKIVTQWPYSAIDYQVLIRLFGRASERTSTRMRDLS